MNLLALESMGFRVGQALGERLPRETLALREELDILKFLCKDLWVAVFQKQMDSLRTNHQGTYVLQDNSFPLLIRMASGLQYVEEAPKAGSRWWSRDPEEPQPMLSPAPGCPGIPGPGNGEQGGPSSHLGCHTYSTNGCQRGRWGHLGWGGPSHHWA
nr:trafficking protein particle complex subunit 6A isoform X3 [Desmodus rotundus]